MYEVNLFTYLFNFQYKKPKVIVEMEKQIKSELKKLKAAKDGDVDCTPS